MAIEIVKGKLLQDKINQSINLMFDTVCSTLGPSGKLVLLDRPNMTSVITKDGVSVAKYIYKNKDLVVAKISEKIFNLSNQTNIEVGDGTTSSIALAKGIYDNATKSLSKDFDPVVLKDQIESALIYILAELDRSATIINTNDELKQIATISSNNDKIIGEIVSNALDAVGLDGSILLEYSDGLTRLQIIDGMNLDRGCSDIRFLKGKPQISLDNCFILCVDSKIGDLSVIDGIVRTYCNGRPLIVISEVSDTVQKFLIEGNARGLFTVVHLVPPAYKATRYKTMLDICTFTGATLINPDEQHLLSIKKEQLGFAEKFNTSQHKTTLLRGKGKKEDILARIEELKGELEITKAEYDKDSIRSRISNLNSGTAIISVGGKTEDELKEKYDRFTDALCATRAALEEGIISGGGFELWKVARNMKEINEGYRVMKDAIQYPIRTIISNTGRDVGKIMKGLTLDEGYDAKRHIYCDLKQDGIIDPLKVTKSALKNAVSIVNLLFNLSAVAVENTNEKELFQNMVNDIKGGE